MGSFFDRLRPAPVGGGFALDDWWVWCGSAIRGEDGRYHLFASRWPRSLRFFEGYKLRSEIVRAVADTPVGPYTFEEVVLPARGDGYWDGKMTHNPTIHRWGETYLLYYIGAWYPGDPPADDAPLAENDPLANQAWRNIRIGLATAPSVYGPWTRLEAPLLEPRPDHWDATITTNPAAVVRPDGSVLLLYRSSGPRTRCHLGLAGADRPTGPYRRLSDEPFLRFDNPEHNVEDPYVWWTGDGYEAIMKDISGTLCGEVYGGVHATSPDGLTWTISDPPRAWSRTIAWDDGTSTTQGCLERPQLLLENGRPTHLFAATGDGPGGFRHASRTWCLVIPLA